MKNTAKTKVNALLIILIILFKLNSYAQNGTNKLNIDEQKTCMISSATASGNIDVIKSKTVRTTGNNDIDDFIIYELENLVKITNLSPSFRLYNDQYAPNAIAIPRKIYKNPYTVLLGIYLVNKSIYFDDYKIDGEVVEQAAHGTHISVIMMHEFAHIGQFTMGVKGPIKKMELQADMMAGWYISQRIDHSVDDPINHGANQLYQLGDFNFNDPNHHGTPQERIDAFWYGYRLFDGGVVEFWDAFFTTKEYLNL